MKRLLVIISIIAAAVSCTKSNIALDQAVEIAMSPIADNITKAAQSGGYPREWHIMLWAYLGSAEASDSPDVVGNYANFNYDYFSGQEFYYKDDKGAWGGLLEPYFWPGHGSLVFAGCALPAPAIAGDASNPGWSVDYDFYDHTNNLLVDKMSIKNYKQSTNTAETFDLMWFGVTKASYNYRRDGHPVYIMFNHALSWITIKVYGDGAPAADGKAWTVKSLVMDDVNTTGNVECVGENATWNNVGTPGDMEVFSGEYSLTTTQNVLETNTNGTLVIPQKPGNLTVTFSSGGSADTVKTVSLKLTDDENDTANMWKPGVHYTYTLVFKANEILVAPSFGEWGEDLDNTITVQ